MSSPVLLVISNQFWKKNKGFTLAELLVVLAIFTIAVLAIFSLNFTAQEGYRQGQTLAEINQNGRVISERMVREIRQAREIVTELPDALNSEVPNDAADSLEFEDGHRGDRYYYIHYFLDGQELKREVKRYYFAGDPDEFFPWNATSSEEELSALTVEGPEAIGEYVKDLEFWGYPVVNIFLGLAKDDREINLRTKVLSRNL